MNDHKLSSLISYLFAEDRKKNEMASSKMATMLADLWKMVGAVMRKTKGYKNEQPKNHRTGDKGEKG